MLSQLADIAFTNLQIGGVAVASKAGARFDVLDPASGDVIAEVADGDVVDGLAAVDAADAAASAWAATRPRDRAEILRLVFELMQGRSEELAQLISLENGKALPDARGEAAYAAEFFRWYSEEAVRAIGDVMTAPGGHNRIVVMHQPVGIAVLVTPWNFPAAMAARKIAPALAAGCTVVLKPASDTPLSALWLASVLAEAGVPPGVVNVIPSRRSGAVVSAMLADRRVRKLSFTGSTEVGRVLLAEAARTVVNVSMELGGNAPFIVFGDCDLNTAVEGALVAKMRNGGEACTAANRFLVEASIAEEFTERLVRSMGRLQVGPGYLASTDVGPLINSAAVEKVDALVREAISDGARLVLGGYRPDIPGSFYVPTVLADVNRSSTILSEEIFGPVAPVVSFETEDEAIALANDTEFGLVSYVYTGDLARGLRLGERLDAGMIGLNRGVVSDPAAPFGGTKQSGIGREGGHHGMLDYMESRYLAVAW